MLAQSRHQESLLAVHETIVGYPWGDVMANSGAMYIDYAPPTFSIGITLSGILIFVVSCFFIARCKRPAPLACFLLFTSLPLIIGILGTFVEYWQLICFFYPTYVNLDAPPAMEVSEGVAGIARCMVPAFMGFAASLPAFFVTAIGLFVRTLKSPQQLPGQTGNEARLSDSQVADDRDE